MNLFAASTILLVILVGAMLYRVVIGPTIFDRFLGAFMAGTTAAFAVAMVGFWYGRPGAFVDMLLAYSLLNFVAGIAAGKFLEKRRGSP